MTSFRIPSRLLTIIRDDLRRHHPTASERVGFVACRGDSTLLVAYDYLPLLDDEYEPSWEAAAQYSAAAINRMLKEARARQASMFNVHEHGHRGIPGFSSIDLRSLDAIMPAFFGMHPGPHGGLVLSHDAAAGAVWTDASSKRVPLARIAEVGAPVRIWRGFTMTERDARQGFLGPHARERLNAARVGLVGFGGGGSHVGQQLAHVKVPKLTVFEHDTVAGTNLNRLVGAREVDVGKPKLDVARRVIEGLMPLDEVRLIPARWQEAADKLRECDAVVGCVDSALERDQLERECRKWLIPYVDIGLGIFMPAVDGEDPELAGQMAVSIPGEHCLRCFGVVTDAALRGEAKGYGDGDPASQVVWPNGVLASLAVGAIVELITGWRKKCVEHRILRYEANGLVGPPREFEFMKLPATCPHYDLKNAGPAVRRTI